MYYYVKKERSNDVFIVDEHTEWLFNEGFRIQKEVRSLSGYEYLMMLEHLRQLSIQQHGF